MIRFQQFHVQISKIKGSFSIIKSRKISQNMIEDLKGFAVQPKLDCLHLEVDQVYDLIQFLLEKNTDHFSKFKCATCDDSTENWICLKCHSIQCSRYVKSHMVTHNQNTKHPIALSFSDSSFWCYDCESYIDHPSLIKARREFSRSKFAAPLVEATKVEDDGEEKIVKQMQELKIKDDKEEKQEEKKKYTYQDLVDGLKNKIYKKIVFLTGAGLSVAAGIPDFRTPGTGLYSQLEKYQLPQPESIFTLSYFQNNPYPFMKLSKQWLQGNFQPTDGHKFMKKVADEGMLLKIMTQNIDDLETKAGIAPEYLLQAHGHSRTAHCIKCHAEASIEEWVECIKADKPLFCKIQGCKQLVKPDIVFFGEQLPKQFFKAPKIVQKEADLVFIIGSSLTVYPFAMLAHVVPPHTPMIMINNTNNLQVKDNFLWLEGDIQENILKICKDIGWEL